MNQQRGFKAYGELTLNELIKLASKYVEEWDGDSISQLEERAEAASELGKAINKILDIVIKYEESKENE